MWDVVPACYSEPSSTAAAVSLATRVVSSALQQSHTSVAAVQNTHEQLISLVAAILSSAKLTDALRQAIIPPGSDRAPPRAHEFSLVGEFADDDGWRRISGHFAVRREGEASTTKEMSELDGKRLVKGRLPICRNIVSCSHEDFLRGEDVLGSLRGRPIGEALLFGTMSDGSPKSTRLEEGSEGGGGTGSGEAIYYTTDRAELARLSALLRPTELAEHDLSLETAWLARRVRYTLHCAGDATVEVVELIDIPALVEVLADSLNADTTISSPVSSQKVEQ